MGENRICVGVFAGAFGVRGDVRLKSFCAEPDAIASYGPLSSEDGTRAFSIHLVQPIKQGFAVRVAGVSTREEADALSGTRLFVPRETLPSLPDDEFYHTDLIGLDVFDTGGERLGKVGAVYNHGAGDVIEIEGKTKPILLPFTRAAVPTVDLEAGRIIADPPEGVL